MKLAAGLAAFAAGIGAILTVVLLAHATPSAGSTSSGPVAAGPPPPVVPPTASPAGFPAPPAGSLVLAREDRDLAVALAVTRGGALQVSVIGQEGPAGRLSVSVDGVPARACGQGCYRVERAPRSGAVRVAIRGAGRAASTVVFAVPATAPPAAAIVRRAERTWGSLRTLVVHDHLASGPGRAIDTLWRFKAPHELTYAIRNGPAAVAIGARRWDKLPGQRWQASEQDPIREPIPLWESVEDARLLGSTTLRSRAVWKVSFFDPVIPAWFTIWVDKATARTLELRMIAQAHFMHQVYGPFDRPLTIVPPA